MSKPKVVVTRKQFDSEMNRLREVAQLTIIEQDYLPTCLLYTSDAADE